MSHGKDICQSGYYYLIFRYAEFADGRFLTRHEALQEVRDEWHRLEWEGEIECSKDAWPMALCPQWVWTHLSRYIDKEIWKPRGVNEMPRERALLAEGKFIPFWSVDTGEVIAAVVWY